MYFPFSQNTVTNILGEEEEGAKLQSFPFKVPRFYNGRHPINLPDFFQEESVLKLCGCVVSVLMSIMLTITFLVEKSFCQENNLRRNFLEPGQVDFTHLADPAIWANSNAELSDRFTLLLICKRVLKPLSAVAFPNSPNKGNASTEAGLGIGAARIDGNGLLLCHGFSFQS